MRNADHEPNHPETGSAIEVARRSAIAAVVAQLQEISRLSPSEEREGTTGKSGTRAGADLGSGIQR